MVGKHSLVYCRVNIVTMLVQLHRGGGAGAGGGRGK